MRQGSEQANTKSAERGANRPARAEFADVLYQTSASEGLSLEWVFDRFERQWGQS